MSLPEDSKQTIDTNYYGVLNVSNALWPLLQPNSRYCMMRLQQQLLVAMVIVVLQNCCHSKIVVIAKCSINRSEKRTKLVGSNFTSDVVLKLLKILHFHCSYKVFASQLYLLWILLFLLLHYKPWHSFKLLTYFFLFWERERALISAVNHKSGHQSYVACTL